MKKLCFAAACLVVLVVCSDLSAQARIRFARGRTSATVSGNVGSNGSRTYVLGARAGQSLSANVSSRGDCVTFTSASTSTSFITEGGSNYLYLTNGCRRPASFTLTVSINYGTD